MGTTVGPVFASCIVDVVFVIVFSLGTKGIGRTTAASCAGLGKQGSGFDQRRKQQQYHDTDCTSKARKVLLRCCQVRRFTP